MIFLILIFTLLVAILVSWIKLLRDSKTINVPGNLPLPLLGNACDFIMVDTVEFKNVLRRLAIKYNDAARFYLGSTRYVVLSHPRYIEPLVSSSELITKGKSYSFLKDWLGDGLLTSTGFRWRTHRKFLTPAFHFNMLQNFMPVFLKNEVILIKNLRTLADGSPINLFPIIALNSLDNVVESIMGVTINAQKDKDSDYVKAIDVVANIVSLRIRNPFIANETIFKLTYKKQQDEALKMLHGQTRKVIETRKEELKKINKTSLGGESEIGIRNKHAFLDLLLLAEVDGQRIDDEKIREEVDTFMFEGHDTTTSGIVFCLYNISRHKDIQNKLYEEQKEIFSDDMEREPGFNEMRQMKYLDLVIKESLRLHPPVPFIERVMTQDADLAELRLTKNTNVIINIFQMQQNPIIYEDPFEFKPDRFKTIDNGPKNAFNWIPFSAGPRNCIGQKYALLEMKVAISAIVRHFELLPAGIEPILCSDLVQRSKNGVYVKLLPRNKTFD